MTEPDSLTIQHDARPSGGRYSWAPGPGRPEAELTYTRAGASTVIIDHTGVPVEYKGQGIGLALVEAVVRDARVAGGHILPVCSFAAAMFRKHPDWDDVLARQIRPRAS